MTWTWVSHDTNNFFRKKMFQQCSISLRLFFLFIYCHFSSLSSRNSHYFSLFLSLFFSPQKKRSEFSSLFLFFVTFSLFLDSDSFCIFSFFKEFFSFFSSLSLSLSLSPALQYWLFDFPAWVCLGSLQKNDHDLSFFYRNVRTDDCSFIY